MPSRKSHPFRHSEGAVSGERQSKAKDDDMITQVQARRRPGRDPEDKATSAGQSPLARSENPDLGAGNTAHPHLQNLNGVHASESGESRSSAKPSSPERSKKEEIKAQPEKQTPPTVEHSADSGATQRATDHRQMDSERDRTSDRIRLKFPGDEMIRRMAPRVLEVGEEAIDIWVKEDFDRVNVSHPLLRLALKTGLKKAKNLEKKVLESPVTEQVVTKIFSAGLKAQNLVDEIKDKAQKLKRK